MHISRQNLFHQAIRYLVIETGNRTWSKLVPANFQKVTKWMIKEAECTFQPLSFGSITTNTSVQSVLPLLTNAFQYRRAHITARCRESSGAMLSHARLQQVFLRAEES